MLTGVAVPLQRRSGVAMPDENVVILPFFRYAWNAHYPLLPVLPATRQGDRHSPGHLAVPIAGRDTHHPLRQYDLSECHSSPGIAVFLNTGPATVVLEDNSSGAPNTLS